MRLPVRLSTPHRFLKRANKKKQIMKKFTKETWRIGQYVWSLRSGVGVITEITDEEYCIWVEFERFRNTYTAKGYDSIFDIIPMLYPYPVEVGPKNISGKFEDISGKFEEAKSVVNTNAEVVKELARLTGEALGGIDERLDAIDEQIEELEEQIESLDSNTLKFVYQ